MKQQREARREEKLAAYRKEQARRQRNRRLGVGGAIVGGIAAAGLIVAFLVSAASVVPRSEIVVAGALNYEDLPANHIETLPEQYPDGTVDYANDYGMLVGAGGNHSGAWLNCGVYELEVPAENAVHSLEHGAVWISYDPSLSAAAVQQLRDALPGSHTILAPRSGLDTPVVVSAWGAELAVDEVDDPRIDQFIDKYWLSPAAPEPNASCSGAYEAPGRVA